jgi:anti-sigma regulatory factor (Ser/Thr protein kinase)
MPVTTEKWTLPVSVTAPAMARSAASPFAQTLGPDRRNDFLLLVSELVTNSVRHAGTIPVDSIDLIIHVDKKRARVEVHDPGPAFELALRQPLPTDRSGWGFLLVDKVAQRWGVEKRATTNVAWFEMDL